MRASRINYIKDIGLLALLSIAWVLTFALVFPRQQDDLDKILVDNFTSEQRSIVQTAVVGAVQRTEDLRASLKRENLGEDKIKKIILESFTRDRFGLNKYGYFFVVDDKGVIIFHPVFPELLGRSLDSITTPDGKNLGEQFDAALQTGKAAFVEYFWTLPGTETVSKKTSYAMKLGGWNWIIAAGFYQADLDTPIQNLREITGVSLAAYKAALILIFALVGAALVALSVVVHLSIKNTERKLTRQLELLERYKLILDESAMVSRTDSKGIITYVNRTFTEVTGYSAEDAVGKSQNIERHPDTPLDTFKDLWATISAGRIWKGIFKNRKADGSSYVKQATIVPIRNEAGDIIEYVSAGQDITELIQRRRELDLFFMTDSLTGLGSRLKLLAELDTCVHPAVGLINIDGFSEINRLYGQNGGDQVLRLVSDKILHELDQSAVTSYRVHADTFAFLNRRESIAGFHHDMIRLHSSLNQTTVQLGSDTVPLVMRLGTAARGRDSYAYADAALEQARLSKSGVHACDKEDCVCSPLSVNSIGVLRNIQRALDDDMIYPVFQPILRIKTGKIEKYECLIRAENPDGSIMLPQHFIDISKKTRRYQMLTLRVIEKSVAYFSKLPWEFSINLTVEDLTSPETVAYLTTTARKAGVMDRLVVEIVETEELVDFERANQTLDRLKAMGIKIAVDDFGSGYASFKYLLSLDPQYIKIDGSIVSSIMTDERARQMLSSIVSFAQDSGMETIAEYVDSQELLDELTVLGVDFAQGWFIGKPLPDVV